MLEVGRRIQRFEITALLGTGGMGSVYRARDTQLERDVAIKVLAQQTETIANELSTFETVDLRSQAAGKTDDLLREARMMARLSHPNVLAVYEVGLVDGAVFLVMELVDGSDLRGWLSAERTRAEILDVYAQACRGLAAAHAVGIVHRDFKPENVLVGRDGRARVGDFGLSRITERSAHASRRTEDAGGTPRFMAPELWAGELATTASDVYAVCVALAEALGGERGDSLERTLRERDVPPALRAAILAGLADEPARRPSIDDVLATLASRPRRRTWAIAAVATGVLAVGATTVGLAASSSTSSCELDLASRWDDAHRAELRAALEKPGGSADVRDRVEHIITFFDEVQRDIDARWLATCEAVGAGTLTEEQGSKRRSCLDRRELELTAKLEHFVRIKPEQIGKLLDRARIADTGDCDEIDAPSLPADRAPVLALYRRLIDTEEMPTPARVEPTAAIARDAGAAGERELEARATINTGIWQSDAGKLADAEESLKHGYAKAVELHAVRLQAIALTMRGRVANRRGDTREALSLANLALELADKSTSIPTRARVYAELGRAAFERGDGPAALEHLTKGMKLVAQDGHQLPFVEASLRVDYTRALGLFEGRKLEALAKARETADWMRGTFGEHSSNYASALTMLASILTWNHQNDEALAIERRCVALMIELSPGDPNIALQRGELAQHLDAAGKFEEARQLFTQELAEAEHNEVVRSYLPLITLKVGLTTCHVGRCNEGYPLVERGLELGIAQYGADHTYTMQYRDNLLNLQYELGKYDDAERNLATMDRVWSAKPKEHARSLAMLHGVFQAGLLVARGKPAQGEKLARVALATWDELRGDDAPRTGLLISLAQTLIAQRRWSEARAQLERARQLTVATKLREDSLAEIDTKLAVIDNATGNHAQAVARARAARAVLDRYPMSIHARAEADRVLEPPKAKRRK